jgi:hypothetical protein
MDTGKQERNKSPGTDKIHAQIIIIRSRKIHSEIVIFF